jgi:hypothetical protein
MRIATRVLGIWLAMAGVALVALSVFAVAGGFDRRSVLAESGPDRYSWIGGSVALAFGVVFILAGRHFFKLDLDALDETRDRPASRFAPYLLAHLHELKVTAGAGFAISLVRLAAVSFGMDWPGKWATFTLYLASIGLLFLGGQIGSGGTVNHLDWEQIPGRIRPALRIVWMAIGPALWVLLLIFAWNRWHYKVYSAVIEAGFVTLLFAWAALFFGYGEIRPADTPRKVLES